MILADGQCLVSAVNAHETAVVLRSRRGPSGALPFWQMLADLSIEVVPFDLAQIHVAASAFDRFGKGIDPNARLNLCDCAAYALAKTRNAPLLFKGDDFTHTDIVAAV